MARACAGVLAGVLVSVAIVTVVGAVTRPLPPRLVPEDASGSLRRVAIHYTPAMDRQALPVWKQLFAALPADVEVAVAVEKPQHFERFVTKMREEHVARVERFVPVVVERPLTTWSRDRMASLDGDAVLAPPRLGTASGPRAGDWEAPFAVARTIYQDEARVADIVFEGGDLAASKSFVFADANLVTHNLGHGDASRAHLQRTLQRTFSQEIIWLGDEPGDVPEHHIMMYMVPLDDHRALVGDVRLGRELAPSVVADADFERHAARFDRVARELVDRGFTVTRVPVVVLPGAGSYVTYTNAVFDRDDNGPVVYLPTYRTPVLDERAAKTYEALGYRVVPIDVSTIYKLNGSLGCLVNVMARD